jgi:hypothetical protein
MPRETQSSFAFAFSEETEYKQRCCCRLGSSRADGNLADCPYLKGEYRKSMPGFAERQVRILEVRSFKT